MSHGGAPIEPQIPSMAKSPDKTLEPPARRPDKPREELVLPDESDQIISDLRSQLRSLQDELEVYKHEDPTTAGGAGIPGEPPPGGAAGAVPELQWRDDFAPHVVARLQGPAEELTARLERVIAQVEDPALREELERCRQTAFYLFDTFRQIGDHHRLLLESIAEDHDRISMATLRAGLEAELAALGADVPLEFGEGLPEDAAAISATVPLIGKTVARIATQLIGALIRVEVAREVSSNGPTGDAICMTITCAGQREGLDAVQDASQIVFSPGVSAITVVDWLYMEKIVELQGGSLTLYHEQGKARGFRVRLPYPPGAR